MFAERISRAVALAAATVVFGAGVATAQTVIVRKAPQGSTVEVVAKGAVAGTATVNSEGDAVVAVNLFGTAEKAETDAYLFVEVCGEARRVLIVERGEPVPPRTSDCERHDLPGLFLVRRVSSLVFDVSTPAPTVLLRQGSYSLKPPRVWKAAPTGLILFGGAGLGRFRDASGIACGAVEGCSGDDSATALTAGAAYWLARFLAAEISYMRPGKAEASATTDTFQFDSELDAEIVNVSAKIGVPIGPTRLYGNIGTSWHRALNTTTQTTGTIVDTFDVQTEGWGWMWAAGFEAWLASSFAIYAEGGSIILKGNAVNVPEGEIDERLNFIVGGFRIRVGR
jgi:hypothetical protein